MTDMENFVKNIKLLRVSANLTQAQLSQVMGCTKQTVSNIESCKHQLSKVTFIAMTAIFLELANTNAILSSCCKLLKVEELLTETIKTKCKTVEGIILPSQGDVLMRSQDGVYMYQHTQYKA